MAHNLIVLVVAGLVSTYSAVVAGAVDPTTQLRDYDAKVCNNEPTCNLTKLPGLTADKLTLPWRDCMCDSDCHEFDDCCQDSEYLKSPKLYTPAKTYYCSPEAKVYMVVSCLPDFTDERIKTNCAKALKSLEENNFHLILPVTNVNKRITYANPYCALCNKDTNAAEWELASGCGEPAKGILERRAAEVKKEAEAMKGAEVKKEAEAKKGAEVKKEAASSGKHSVTTPKTNHNHLNIDLHLNPGALVGKKDANGGFHKNISIPTFGNLGTKLANKTLGSATGLFGAKTSVRRKRESSLGSLDFNKYSKKVPEIVKVLKYDHSVKEFIAKYENKTLVCKIGFKLPAKLKTVQRSCLPNVISECPNDEKANKVCQSYVKYVHNAGSKKTYRNIDCAKCNGVDLHSAMLKGCYQGSRSGGSTLFGAGAPGECGEGLEGSSFC